LKMLVAPSSRIADVVTYMAQGCRKSVANFRTVGIVMIEIFKAITEFVKSNLKNLRKSDGFIGRM